MSLTIYTIFLVAIYFGFARAELTRPLWSRYTGFLDKLARCPACSGTWIGLALSYWLPLPWGESVPGPARIVDHFYGAALGCVVTPIAYWLFSKALEATAVPAEEATNADGTHPNENAVREWLIARRDEAAQEVIKRDRARGASNDRAYWAGKHKVYCEVANRLVFNRPDER